MQDKLRRFGNKLGWIRNNSDEKMLGLQYGLDNVTVDVNYGNDFFLESEDDIMKLISEAPNPIEAREQTGRLVRKRGQFNKPRAERAVILYKLIPFSTYPDFELAKASELVDTNTEHLFLRFNYWIVNFEAEYGDIVMFWDGLGDMQESSKLLLINTLLNEIIENGTEESENSKPESVQT